VKRATYVIDTNGSLVQTNAQVHKLYQQLLGS
jgi:dephospho-CoA kinase